MPYIDLGPAPTEGSPAQDTGFVDLGPAPTLEPTQKLKAAKEILTATQNQVRAESQSLDRYKIQRLMGLNPDLSV